MAGISVSSALPCRRPGGRELIAPRPEIHSPTVIGSPLRTRLAGPVQEAGSWRTERVLELSDPALDAAGTARSRLLCRLVEQRGGGCRVAVVAGELGQGEQRGGDTALEAEFAAQ